MSAAFMQAREELLAAAHRVMSGRIDASLPGPHDDAEAEYAEDELVKAAQKLAREKIADRLGRHRHPASGDLGISSALARRIIQTAEAEADDAGSEVGVSKAVTSNAEEAGVMEMALAEIADKCDGENMESTEAQEIARDALPEGAVKP